MHERTNTLSHRNAWHHLCKIVILPQYQFSKKYRSQYFLIRHRISTYKRVCPSIHSQVSLVVGPATTPLQQAAPSGSIKFWVSGLGTKSLDFFSIHTGSKESNLILKEPTILRYCLGNILILFLKFRCKITTEDNSDLGHVQCF